MAQVKFKKGTNNTINKTTNIEQGSLIINTDTNELYYDKSNDERVALGKQADQHYSSTSSNAQSGVAVAEAVTEKPLELIETYTLIETTHTFERTIDTQGNNYSFKKIIGIIDFPETVTTSKRIDFYTDFAGGHLAADAITGTSYSGNRLLIFTYTGTNTAPHGCIVAKAIIENDVLNFEISSAAFTSMSNVAQNNCIYKSAYLVKANGKKLNIVGFHFGASESDVFPIGTKFNIYGVK